MGQFTQIPGGKVFQEYQEGNHKYKSLEAIMIIMHENNGPKVSMCAVV